MKQLPVRLNQNDRDKLAQFIEQQTGIGARSSEAIQRVVCDGEGMHHDLGGEYHRIAIGPDNAPIIISEQRAKILDCGHAVTSLAQVLGMCSYGHIVCDREKLYRCTKCRSILCAKEVEYVENQPVCPECTGGMPFGVGVLIIVLAAVAIYFITR